VLVLEGSKHSPVLAGVLNLGPEFRAALQAVAQGNVAEMLVHSQRLADLRRLGGAVAAALDALVQEEGLKVGVQWALKESWPDEVVDPPPASVPSVSKSLGQAIG
jgi:hypothetical protein